MEEQKQEQNKKRKVCVCNGPACSASFGAEILEKVKERFFNDPNVEVKTCGCTGHCSLSNNITVDDVVISRITPQNAAQNVEKALAGDIFGAGGGVAVDPFNLEDDKFLGI